MLVLVLSLKIALGATWFVATTGSDKNSGTSINEPFLTLDQAVENFQSGDSIIIRGGTYKHSVTIKLSVSGSEGKECYLLAYPGEVPVLDFSGTAFGKRGIDLTGSYWLIKGLHITLAGDNGMIIKTGGNNLIENCSFYRNKDSGLQIGGGSHDNRIINCDSYFNADPSDYGDADGFACKLDVGTNNYFYGCRAWVNVDDGWDGYLRGAENMTTIVENCWTWGNGYLEDGTDPGAKANGNGFKMGGSDDKTLKHNFIIKNSLAFYNKAKGFDQNNNMGSMQVYNCTGLFNDGNDFSIPGILASGQTAEVKNCVLADGKKSLNSFVVQESNSWDSRFTVTKEDFLSFDTTGVSGSRKDDGSLPDISFVHLAEGSDLINAGIDLGLPFNGSKPDLGCFETDYSSSSLFNKTIDDDLNLRVKYSGYSQLEISFITQDENDFNCNLRDINGRKVWSLTKSAGRGEKEIINIGTSLFPEGIYLFQVKTSNRNIIKKIVIRK